MALAFLVTTYNRERSCKKLVKELTKYGDVYLRSDGSMYEINDSWCSKHPVFFAHQEHLGKKYYSETVNNLFSMPQKKYDYYFMIGDDLMPVKDFTKQAIKTWKGIKDERKICLTTYLEESRIGKACWTGFNPIEYKDFYLTQWTDMIFMCESKFFEVLGKIPYQKLNWSRRPELSSGVGSHISRHLYKKGWNMYQVKSSLFTVQPEAKHSQMNPWRTYNDPINKPVL